MEKLSNLLDEIDLTLNEVVNLNDCLHQTLDSKLTNSEDCFCTLSLAGIIKNKLEELQKKHTAFSDEFLLKQSNHNETLNSRYFNHL